MNDEQIPFRLLRADEIDVRIGQINKAGVSLLLYKDARCDQNILDETVGPYNWQRHHSRDNANCILAIRNEHTGEWIEKEDTGVESYTEKEKGLASDSFKRAAFNWGIGRELYTAPKMFVFKSDLQTFEESGDKYRCYDTFKVEKIDYSGRRIASVIIGIYAKGKKHKQIAFSNEENAKTVISTAPATATPAPATAATTMAGLTEDEIILIGNCKGKKYGEVKETDVFKSFLRWVKSTNTKYPDPNVQNQFERLKALA